VRDAIALDCLQFISTASYQVTRKDSPK